MNHNYWHGIPQQKQIREPRINITCFAKFTGNPFTAELDRDRIPDLTIPRDVYHPVGYLVEILSSRSPDTPPTKQLDDEHLALYLQALEFNDE